MKKKRTKGRILSLLLTVCMLLGTLPAELFGGVTAVTAADTAGYTLSNTTTWTFTKTYAETCGVTVGSKLSGTVMDGITITQDTVKMNASNYLSLNGGAITLPIAEDTDAVEVTITLSGTSNGRSVIIGEGTKQEKVYHTSANAPSGLCFDSGKAYTNDALYLKSDNMFSGTLSIATVSGEESKVASIVLKEYKKDGDTDDDTTYAINLTAGEGSAEGAECTRTPGDDQIAVGTEVTVTAAAADDTQYGFKTWVVKPEGITLKDTDNKIVDLTSEKITFAMPSLPDGNTALELEATYGLLRALTVTNGTAANEEQTNVVEGTEVTITVESPAQGTEQEFGKWSIETEGVTLETLGLTEADLTKAELKFTMPASDLAIKANYTASYAITVEGGSADKQTAAEGATITITAEGKPGHKFESWEVVSGEVTLADSTAKVTTFTMPASAVTIKANHVEADELTYVARPEAVDTYFTLTGESLNTSGKKYIDLENGEVTGYIQLGTSSTPINKSIKFTVTEGYTARVKVYALSSNGDNNTILTLFSADASESVGSVDIYGANNKKDGSGNAYGAKAANPIQGVEYDKTLEGGTTYYVAATGSKGVNIYYMEVTETKEGSATYNITPTDCTVTDAEGNPLPKAAAGTEVTVQATVPEGQEFEKWEVTPATLSLTDEPTEEGKVKATFTMPAEAVTVKAVYKAKTYALTVTNGTAKATNEAGEVITSPLPAGAKVVLTPDAAPAGQIFDKWVVTPANALTLTEEQAKDTGLTFEMPASDMEIAATYKSDANAHTITVTGGTATPAKAEQGTTITIKANAAPDGQEFDKWVVTPATVKLVNERAEETTFTMPAEAVEVEATYKKRTVVDKDPDSSEVKAVEMDPENKPVFKDAQDKDVSGNIIIHAEKVESTSAMALLFQTKIEELIADVAEADKENVKKLYYDISAYLDKVEDANKVSMTEGKVKIRFDYPEGVTSRNEIIALHGANALNPEGIKEVEVENKSDGFWITADGFSPYTILILPVAESSVTITREGGYEEGAFAEWNKVAGADGYLAYVSTDPANFPESSRIDNELLREYADHWRVDTVGLKKGTYYIKVVAATVDKTTKEATPIGEAVTGALTVEPYDRTGFAFAKGSDSKYSGTGLGAYNNDGTLDSRAQVIYVTADTAKTCTATVNGKTVTGIQTILDEKQKKGTENDILDIRIIGKVSKADLDHISSSEEGLQIKGNGKYNNMNITIEGIGEDAAVHGFGFLVRNCANVEFRNFAVMDFMDDGISLDTANCNIWIHDMDIFYGSAGSAADQKKGDGSIDVKGKSTHITISYNHFWDSGKCSLCGMSDTEEFMVTYHHNWFDHSDSRHARVRVGSIHFYNNYYDGNSKYGVGVTKASSAFVEANYFKNCKYPMLISQQGSDIAPPAEAKGTFSGEPGGMIKAYNNVVEGKTSRLIYANAGQGIQGATGPADNKQFDAYLASERKEEVDEFYVTAKGGTPYNNFDLTYDLGVSEGQIDDPEEVPAKVMAKAGRLNGGDLKWTFTDDDNESYSVDSTLKSKVENYTSSVVSIGGIDGVASGSGSGGGGAYVPGEDDPDDGNNGDGDDPILSTGTVHNFTTDGNASSYYTISGNMKSNPDPMSYGGMTLTKALKLEGSTLITFTTASTGTLILVQDKNKKTKIDDKNYTSDASGVLKVENLPAGAHEITKGDSANLYYIAFLPDGGSEDPNPPAAGSYKITVTNATASAASAKAGEKITISAKTIAGKTFKEWVVTPADKVELANKTSATTTFTMPASDVTIVAQYEDAETPVDPVDPVDPENKDFELNVTTDLKDEVGDHTETFEKNGFTILAGDGVDANGKAAQSVSVDSGSAVTIGGVKYTGRLKTGGAGNDQYRSIKFTTTGAATVTIVAVSSNSKDSRIMGISDGTKDADGKLIDQETKTVGTSASTYTFKVTEAGTYYIHSQASGLNFYYIGVKYVKQGETSGRVDDEVREQAPDFKDGDLYASTKGTSAAAGSFEDPMDLKTALNSITPGHTIWMFSGTYYAYDVYEEPIIIAETNSGTADALKKISSINGKRVTIDFDGMEEAGSNRGITLDGSYWHFYDIDICNAGDNGMLLSGDHNVIELCQFYGNHDTGLQLSRFNTSYASIEQWPSYNLILNCTAFNNKDEETTENADGFAAKLTCGEGNVFDGCIAYCNSDDGWDLYAKTATGPIGQVTLRNCISFANGKLTNGEGSANGDMNGFKLGGSGVATAHIVENCLAFNNGATGFTDNNNPGAHTITNCTAVNNGRYDANKANLMIYRASSDAQYTNLLSSVDNTKATTDQFKGTLSNSLYHYKDEKTNGSYYWVNSYNFGGDKQKYTGSEKADYTVTDADFVNVTIPGYNKAKDAYTADYHEIFRNPDGSINVDGLFEVKKESPLYTAGKDDTYIGAKFSDDDAPKTYTVSVESGSASPVKAEAGATVTITADTVPGMVFDKWTVKTGSVNLADATSAETTFTMPASLVEIVAEYKKAEAPVYNISITGGSATPTQAAKGTKVTITAAAAPEGKVFDKWVVKAGGITLADETSATTTFIMGDKVVELEAVYKDAQTTPVDPTPEDPTPVDPTPVDPTPTDPVTPENPVTPGDSDDDDDDDDYEEPAAPETPAESETPAAPSAPAASTDSGKRVVKGDKAVVTDAQVVGNATFTRPNGNEATGDIIIHAETFEPTKDILKAVEEYTKKVKDASKIIVQYYDIKAYEGVIDSAHQVTLNGKVKIKFQYPAGVTKDNYDIIALHNITPVPVEMQKSFFWITADGFSPYTIVYLPKEAQSAQTGDTATVQPDNAQAANQDPVVGGAAAVVTPPQNSGSSVFVIVLIAMIVGVAAIGFGILATRRKKDTE